MHDSRGTTDDACAMWAPCRPREGKVDGIVIRSTQLIVGELAGPSQPSSCACTHARIVPRQTQLKPSSSAARCRAFVPQAASLVHSSMVLTGSNAVRLPDALCTALLARYALTPRPPWARWWPFRVLYGRLWSSVSCV